MKPIITQTNDKDLQVTKRLKYLTPGQNTLEEIQARDLVQELALKETSTTTLSLALDQDRDSEIENLSDDQSSDDPQDQQHSLISELEKIRKEKKEKLPPPNPLLNLPSTSLKRHWTQDTLFKNQKPILERPEEEKFFVNDILHQESHRKFMQKHIR